MDSPSSGERSGTSPELKAPDRAHCILETCLERRGWTPSLLESSIREGENPVLGPAGGVLWGALDESRCLGMQRKGGW